MSADNVHVVFRIPILDTFVWALGDDKSRLSLRAY